MRRALRIALVLPAIGGLAALGFHAYRVGEAETIAFAASQEIETWTVARARPGVESWLWVRNDLQRARQLAPRNPAVEEMLGVLHVRRSARPEYLQSGEEHFLAALALRPSSPYTWANLAMVRYELGRTEGSFERILSTAAMLGPSEPEVQRAVVDLGLALWDEVGPETRQRIDRAIGAGMYRNPMEILRIAERRGKLAAACRHVTGDKRRIDPAWIAACAKEEGGTT